MSTRDRSLIAVQGPKSAQILQPFVDVSLDNLYFMSSIQSGICGVDNCRVTRCGYTGEDGFEISLPSEHATEITETLLNNEFVKLAGLGARDTLR
jgi:aminomethyltransferase